MCLNLLSCVQLSFAIAFSELVPSVSACDQQQLLPHLHNYQTNKHSSRYSVLALWFKFEWSTSKEAKLDPLLPLGSLLLFSAVF